MQALYIKTVARKTILFITIFWITTSFAQGQSEAINRNTKDQKEVLQTERELLQAFIQGDRNTLNRLLADNYRMNDSLTKQEILKDLRPRPNTTLDTSSLKARLFGDSAEVSGILLVKMPGLPDMYHQVVDRLVKHTTAWQSVTTQREMMPVWEGKLLKDSKMTLLTPLLCNQRPHLYSLNTDQSAMMKFTNATAQPVIIRWINYDGELDTSRHLINTLLPGKSMVFMTFVTHPFVVTDKAGRCLRIFKPNQEPSLAVIK